MTTTTQLQEFIGLWIRLQGVQLQLDVQDTITWKWTADGVYSTRSVYLIQFRGSHRKFKHELIWKAQAENKCKLHAWILMHNKVLTADNLQKRGWLHQDHGAAAAAGPYLHWRMVGRCSKQDPKTGTQTFEWSINIYCVKFWKERNNMIF